MVENYLSNLTVEDIILGKLKIEEKIYERIPENSVTGLTLRNEFTKMGMFGFVSWNWINPLAEWIGDRKCLEVMAGRGWLTRGLRDRGTSIRATDDFSWHKEDKYKRWENLVTYVEELDAIESVEKYGKNVDILIMSWPYMDDTAYEVIKTLYEVNPKAVVVYCGEGRGGCTASDKLFGHFKSTGEDVNNRFHDKVASKYESWQGIYDYLDVGRYTN